MAERPRYYPNAKSLEDRAQKLERVKGLVQTIYQNLGGDQGPTGLNIINPQILPEGAMERVAEIVRRGTKVAQVREYGETKKIPYINSQIDQTTAEIKRVEELIHQGIPTLRGLSAFLRPEEIAAIEAQLRLVTPDVTLTAAPSVPEGAPSVPPTPVSPGIQEGATAENETRPTHKIVVNLIENKNSVDGRNLAIKSPIQNATFMQLARNPGKDFTESELTEIAKKAGSENPRAGSMMVFYLRKILEPDPKNPTILIRTENGHRLDAEVEIIEKGAAGEEKADLTGQSDTQPKKETGKKVSFTLPDGQEITVTKIQAEILGLLSATKVKAITYEEWANPLWQEENIELPVKINWLSVRKTALNRKVLQEKGYQIANAETSKLGTTARFYLEKTLAAPEKTGYPQQPDIEVLQKEIAELQSRITSIEGRIQKGDLSENSNLMLETFREELNRKKDTLAAKEKLPMPLPVSIPEGTKNLSADGGNNDIIPYQRPPETIRTPDETNILTFIADELSKYDRLWFDRIQNGLNAYQNPSRYTTIGGLDRRRFKPYGANELKQLLARAIKKMEDDSQIPLRRKDWNSEDESTWTKLQNLIQRIGEGDERRFIQRVNGLIDKASNDYYAIHPEIKPGEDWII